MVPSSGWTGKCFVADPARVSDKRPAYSIVIPPPNVTGMLHMGHVLNNTIQDILSPQGAHGRQGSALAARHRPRRHRHAGAWSKRTLKKAGDAKPNTISAAKKFLERVWEWKEKHGGIIIQQLKKLGCSCDWTRERFTMDPEYSRCVQQVFVELYRRG